ncbi:MAG: ROK family protein [Actinobacteria bacterium]|nr:ROK family protein [Actinomycetota bacterium]
MRKIEKKYAIGLDIGGTTIKSALVDNLGSLIDKFTIETPRISHQKIFNAICNSIDHIYQKASALNLTIRGIGVGIPGYYDKTMQVVEFLPNIPELNGFHLWEKLYQKYNTKIILDADIHMAVLAEYLFGDARKFARSIFTIIGTGVGMAVMIDGKLLRYNHQSAGQLGHMILKPGGPICSCGNRGCLEALVSSKAFERLALEAIKHNKSTSIRDIYFNNKRITAKDVDIEAAKGDPVSKQIFKEVGFWLAITIVNLVNIYEPEAIFLMGGISQSRELITDPIKETLQTMKYPETLKDIKIEIAKTGFNAGLIGAANSIFQYEYLKKDKL